MEKRDGGNDAAQSILGVVALVVSVVALFGTILQVAQQYYASARGYAECGESVMGKWHTSKKRVFRPSELRFEVQFETPVIFVSPPTNTKGPVKDAPIYFVDGSIESLSNTRTLLPMDDRKKRDELVVRAKQVHTADNERATWVTMLSELQNMEKESQTWQRNQYGQSPPTSQPQAQFINHTLAVALQSKKRSWDTMPSTVKKPYATTAMCHLLEIAAMLGLHWKQFNRSVDRYRAEGNGYILTGTKVPDLGLMFTFLIYGKSRFHENRVIPVDEVKELCCGYVSTIFRKDTDGRRLELTEDEPEDLSILQVGSANELAETMVLIGCNTNTANYFRSDKTKHGHLFPVAFELVGMLSKNLHIPNSCFRMLPNPTPYHWDKKFFSLRKLLHEYKKKVLDDDITLQTEQVHLLARLAEKVESELRSSPHDFSIPLLDVLHGAVDKCDEFLRAHISRDLVTMVLREHFQEVTRMVNEDHNDTVHVTTTTTTTTGATTNAEKVQAPLPPMPDAGNPPQYGDRTPRFDDLNSASPEEKQEKFMDIYFAVVLPRVMRQAVDALCRRSTTRYYSYHDSSAESTHSNNNEKRNPNSSSPSASPGGFRHGNIPSLHEKHSNGTEGSKLQPADVQIQIEDHELDHHLHEKGDRNSRGHQTDGPDALRFADRETLDTQANNIWCTLVFRMLCWLLLHDFHRRDVQIAKSELLGSRLPVYIA